MIKNKIYINILLIFFIGYGVKGQNIIRTDATLNTITTAVPLLLIAPDARAGAMGDAGVASTPDINSQHWNPAKYAFSSKSMGFGVSYTPWLRALISDVNLAYLSWYKKLNDKQCIAASLLYFSLGDITFTDAIGNTIGHFAPNEWAVDFSYSRKLAPNFSFAVSPRFIYSNLTGSQFVSGAETHPGHSVAADVSGYYRKKLEFKKIKALWAWGFNFSNIGTKISYTETIQRDFIPMNFRLGTSFQLDIDQYNSLEFLVDVNKLLVPTPPTYYNAGDTTSTGHVVQSSEIIIKKGMNPNRTVADAFFTSWYDAPGGSREELREYTVSAGIEYWYDKQFSLRAGYFYEAPTKGNRKYFTLGAGLRYNVFALDFSYLIPTQQHNPLENTLRFTLLFDFEAFKEQNKNNEKTE